MPVLHKNINAEIDIHVPKWMPSANVGDVAWKNELGELEATDELVLPAALNFVDASVAPPTTNAGDIYVLSSGGSVNAGWGSVALKDWVRYDGTTWNEVTPQKSSLCYDKTTDSLKFYDGTNWADVASGIQNLTTAEKSALTPSTVDFVFDTDLNSFQRYNGSAWVDLAKGYGTIQVIRDTDSGVPSYYTDLQTALETCKTSGSNNIVNIYSDIALSSEIVMNDGGTGTGNGYLFDNLTLDLNGFMLSYDGANTDSVINADLFGLTTTFKIQNGKILRTNSTGGYALTIDSCTFKTENLETEGNSGGLLLDNTINEGYLGWCKFISKGSNPAVQVGGGYTENFYAENTSSGNGLYCNISKVVRNFHATSDSGSGLQLITGECDSFKAKSNSSYGIYLSASSLVKISNFITESVSSYGIRRSGFGSISCFASNFEIRNGGFRNDGSFSEAKFSNFRIFSDFNNALSGNIDSLEFYNGSIENEGSFHAASIRLNNVFENVSFIGNDFEAVNFVDSGNVNDSVLKNCNFTCLLDTSAGHAIDVGGIDSGNADFINCTFEVVNAGANCITASTAETITVLNSSYKGATTPVNANVTITASTDEGNGNRSI